MSHTIHGYVAKHEDLLRVFGRAARLPQGFGFTPDSVHDYQDESRDFDVSDKQEKTAIARIQSLAWVQTDFFGGGGTQSAKLWVNGKLVYNEHDSHGHPINDVLKRMGVKCVWPEGKPSRQYIDGDGKPVSAPAPDEFDAVNFGYTRDNEDFVLEVIPSDERQKLQTEWKVKQVARPPEEARAGDYIKLLVQWQDMSGIPLIAHPPGTVLKVACPDLTSGGVVVECEEGTFSLTPDQYEITEPPDE